MKLNQIKKAETNKADKNIIVISTFSTNFNFILNHTYKFKSWIALKQTQ